MDVSSRSGPSATEGGFTSSRRTVVTSAWSRVSDTNRAGHRTRHGSSSSARSCSPTCRRSMWRASRAGRLSSAFCLTFGDASYSEWPKAEATARQLGVPLTEVRIGAAAIEDFLGLVEHADDPLADSSGMAVWVLAREVSRHCKVVLSGDGGDELRSQVFSPPANDIAVKWRASKPEGIAPPAPRRKSRTKKRAPEGARLSICPAGAGRTTSRDR